jgi:hypothetical protein
MAQLKHHEASFDSAPLDPGAICGVSDVKGWQQEMSGDDGLARGRRCAGSCDRSAGAAHRARLIAGAGMPDRPRRVLALAVAAYQCLFSQSARIGAPVMSKRSK